VLSPRSLSHSTLLTPPMLMARSSLISIIHHSIQYACLIPLYPPVCPFLFAHDGYYLDQRVDCSQP
jgi:hypothetical protein